MPYVDFRVFREPDREVTTKDIAKLSIARLLRINRNLSKYNSAYEIIDLLKQLQRKYNGKSSKDEHGDQCARTAELVRELFDYIKRHGISMQSNSTQSSLKKGSKDVCLQADPKEIIGLIGSQNVKLPSIFSPFKNNGQFDSQQDDLSMIEMNSNFESES